MEDDVIPPAPIFVKALQFAVGVLEAKHVSNNTLQPFNESLNIIKERLEALPFAGLNEAKSFMSGAFAILRVNPHHLDVVDDLKEAKEHAIDSLVTVLSPDQKLDIFKFIIISEMLLFLSISTSSKKIQDKIRFIQTTRRVCNVYLKRMNDIRQMNLFLVEKLCRHGDVISDVWQKEGVEIEDVPIDVEVEAAKLQFVKEVYVINLQTHAFLDLVQTDFVESSPGLVADVVGPIQCEPVIKVNVTEMSLGKVMRELYAVTKDEGLRLLLGIATPPPEAPQS